jgi:hypothetical protein
MVSGRLPEYNGTKEIAVFAPALGISTQVDTDRTNALGHPRGERGVRFSSFVARPSCSLGRATFCQVVTAHRLVGVRTTK